MSKMYKCDWGHSDDCIGVTEHRKHLMRVTVDNDRQQKLHCCHSCLPSSVKTPSHMGNDD